MDQARNIEDRRQERGERRQETGGKSMRMFCPQAIKDNRTGGEVGRLFPCVVLGRPFDSDMYCRSEPSVSSIAVSLLILD